MIFSSLFEIVFYIDFWIGFFCDFKGSSCQTSIRSVNFPNGIWFLYRPQTDLMKGIKSDAMIISILLVCMLVDESIPYGEPDYLQIKIE